MKYLISVFLSLFITACAVQVDDMTAEPTLQSFDLVDSEGDAVINARDQCPTSFSGAQVDSRGCGAERIEKVRRNLLVNFAKNSYIVAELSSEQLFTGMKWTIYSVDERAE